MRLRWPILPALIIVLSVAAGPVGASVSTSSVTEIADALRGNPVYVDPTAERALAETEAEELRAAIRDQEQAIFVAVLPSSMGATPEDADQLVREIVEASGLGGTYAVIVGDRFRATSTAFANADEIASAAFQARADEGAAAVLTEFVGRVASDGVAGGGGASRDPGVASDDGADSGDDPGSSTVPLALLAAGGGGLYLWSRRRRRREAAANERAMAADRQMLQAELSVIADDVMRLESIVAIHPEARTDYDAAVERYRIAAAALDYADEPIDLVRVQRVLDEARYAMSRARAITEGREPPPPPAELRRPGRHDEPALEVDDRGEPHYVGGGPFYGGGWFGGGGGLFSGLLLGSMLGGWGGLGWGHHVEGHDAGDGGRWGGDGAGWGDGGWGDMDVGGGDWGGDMGGGDW